MRKEAAPGMTVSSNTSDAKSKLATIKLCATLASQATVAALVTIANKGVLNVRAAPSTLLFLQQAVILLGYEFTSSIFGSEADHLPWAAKKQLVIATIPLAVLNCLALVLKTICLQHVPAAIYQIVRGLLIPFTVLLSFVILSSKPGLASAGGLAIIMSGFFLSCSPSALTSASVFGVTMGVVSSAATALYIVVMKLITARKSWKDTAGNISTFNIAYYNTLVTGAALGLVSIFTEGSDLVEVLFQESWYQNDFLIGVLGSGLLSGLLAVLTIAQVKLTSPTAHMVSASVRGSLQSGLALVAFPAEAKAFTLVALSSTILIVVGGGCFAIGESLKARAAKAQAGLAFSESEVAMEEKEQSASRSSSEALLFDSSVEEDSPAFRDNEKV